MTASCKLEGSQLRIRRHIALIGSSGSGKSTIWKRVKERCSAQSDIGFPTRYISRPLRFDDDAEENQFIARHKFPDLFERREIAFYWEKPINSELAEQYGFPFHTADTIVYGCNNAFLLHRERLISNIPARDAWLFIHISCNPEERISRLNARKGFRSLSIAEVQMRLKDQDTEVASICDHSVNNGNGRLDSATDTVLSFLG